MTTSNPWVSTNLKPLSANEAFAPRAVKRGRFWSGDIYKTKKYKDYERALLSTLPDLEIPETNIHLKVQVQYLRKNSDIDNCLKPFIDCLQKRYDFDDKHIYKLTVVKKVVPKAEVGIKFWIGPMEQPK